MVASMEKMIVERKAVKGDEPGRIAGPYRRQIGYVVDKIVIDNCWPVVEIERICKGVLIAVERDYQENHWREQV